MYFYVGSDEAWVGDGRPSDNIVRDNTIVNAAVGVKLKETDDTTVKGEIVFYMY